MIGGPLADLEQFVQWSSRVEARAEFPNLLRRLISRTNDSLFDLQMGGGNEVDFSGYDGIVHARLGTLMVPEGKSVWELKAGDDFKDAATAVYKSRTEDSLGIDPKETTFVLATPRRWPNHEKWVQKRRDEKKWKDVVVYDASRIHGLLETVLIEHVRFSESIGVPANDFETLGAWWERYADVPGGLISAELVLLGRTDQAAELVRILKREDRSQLWIHAPSIEDVIAFVGATLLSAATGSGDDLLDRVLVVYNSTAIRYLDRHTGLIIIVPFEESLVRSAELVTKNRVILRSESGAHAALELPSIDIETARKHFRDLGVPDVNAGSHAVALSKNIRLLRSRLLSEPLPETDLIARELVNSTPARRMWLLGSWNDERSGDREVVETLIEGGDAAILVQLASAVDPVFAHVGPSWKVISPETHLRKVAAALTGDDLVAFEAAVQVVLGAVNPSLDVPSTERWKAGLYGPGRLHSGDLRNGISTTLALFGAHGNDLKVGGGPSLRGWAELLVRATLQRASEDASAQLWLSIADLLPLLAEAAPDVFIEAMERELDGGSMRDRFFTDSDDPFQTASPHVYFINALEVIAWSPDHTSAAAEILIRLAEIDPGGKLSNRPAQSLEDVFRPWLPQTLAGVETRIAILKALIRRHR